MEEEVLRAGEAVINKRKQSFKRKENAVNNLDFSYSFRGRSIVESQRPQIRIPPYLVHQ